MTLSQLKPSFLSLSEPAQLDLILEIRASRTQFKSSSQTRSSKAKVAAVKKDKKAAGKTLASLSLQEKLNLLKELQNESSK